MWTDPIIKEIHQIRAEHAAQFNYDLTAMVKDLQKEEQESGKSFVSFPPRLFAEEQKTVLKAKKDQEVIKISPALAESV
jgi:hypothetical protein